MIESGDPASTVAGQSVCRELSVAGVGSHVAKFLLSRIGVCLLGGGRKSRISPLGVKTYGSF